MGFISAQLDISSHQNCVCICGLTRRSRPSCQVVTQMSVVMCAGPRGAGSMWLGVRANEAGSNVSEGTLARGGASVHHLSSVDSSHCEWSFNGSCRSILCSCTVVNMVSITRPVLNFPQDFRAWQASRQFAGGRAYLRHQLVNISNSCLCQYLQLPAPAPSGAKIPVHVQAAHRSRAEAAMAASVCRPRPAAP
jgi:hypothetical protein